MIKKIEYYIAQCKNCGTNAQIKTNDYNEVKKTLRANSWIITRTGETYCSKKCYKRSIKQ